MADHRLPSWSSPPHWPPQHTKLGILWSGLNINLCHSRATADSQAHSRVFCGEFGTNLAKYFKPEGFYYWQPAGLWWPICSHIQIDLTEFHQGKVIQEISLFLHLCVAVLSGPVDWHWLWGIDSSYWQEKSIIGTWKQGKQKTKYNYIMKCWDICKYLRINFLNQLSFKTKYGAI